MHSHPWYYEVILDDGEVVATLHLDEGVTIVGYDALLRVTTRDRVTTLWKPGGSGHDAVATYFVGNAGLFSTVRRVTLGDRRAGGYVLDGNGWRGSWLLDAASHERMMTFVAQGDPAVRYCVTPSAGRSLPLAVAVLTSYILMEREAQGWAVASRLERRRRIRRDQ
jgi:hypothetical protein